MTRHWNQTHKETNEPHLPPQQGVPRPPPPPQQGVPPPPPPPQQGVPPPPPQQGVPPPPHRQGVPPPPEGASPPQEENMVFYHPFTMMISGPTGNLLYFFLKYFTFLLTFVA